MSWGRRCGGRDTAGWWRAGPCGGEKLDWAKRKIRPQDLMFPVLFHMREEGAGCGSVFVTRGPDEEFKQNGGESDALRCKAAIGAAAVVRATLRNHKALSPLFSPSHWRVDSGP